MAWLTNRQAKRPTTVALTLTGRTRRRTTFVFTVIAGILMIASTAWACTVYKGKFTLTQGTTSLTNYGNNSGMDFCPKTTEKTMTLSSSTFTLEASPTTNDTSILASCRSQLSDDTDSSAYQIKTEVATAQGAINDCMNGPVMNGGGNVTVSSGSTGPVSLNGSDLPVGHTAICITGPNHGINQGNGMVIAQVA